MHRIGMRRLEARRLASDAGIAIGPILFIIALLGILAAAIAAGSGSFTSSTTNESDETKAAALINIKAIGLNNTDANNDSAAIGDPTAANANLNLLANGSWPVLLNGQLVGCINDTSNNDAAFWFYQ